MTDTSDIDVGLTTKRFLEKTLPKTEWTHEAHFGVALFLLRDLGQDAFSRMPVCIRAYNEATGVTNSDHEGYHETITQASLRAANHMLRQHSLETPLASILAKLMNSPFGRSDWLFAHWSKSRLFSVEARRSWVEPDISQLPF